MHKCLLQKLPTQHKCNDFVTIFTVGQAVSATLGAFDELYLLPLLGFVLCPTAVAHPDVAFHS